MDALLALQSKFGPACVSSPMILANPTSVSLAVPSRASRMFADLRSMCTTRELCR